MATQEKLQKSLETLKGLASISFQDAVKKKEKIQHIQIITESVGNPTIKVSKTFHQTLGTIFEIFLKLCDDSEADVRMITEECLNRIIRIIGDDSISKIQIELHKEIKRNGSARSLRAALVRFSQLAHLIRPHKGRPYVANLFPSIVKIAERSEEQIHETLSSCLPKIIRVLGCFSPDSDIRVLLRAFLVNVSNQSAVIRRTAANCILNISLHSRKPFHFLSYSLNNLLDNLLPISDNAAPSSTILGVMGCLKLILPDFMKLSCEENVLSDTDKLLQIYELCLNYLENKDHNVINASLETLHILLENCIVNPSNFKRILLSENGLNKSRISRSASLFKLRSPSQLSVATNITISEENELTETIHSDIEKWIDESQLSMISLNVPSRRETDTEFDSEIAEYSDMAGNFTTGFLSNIDHLPDQIDKLTISENSSEKSFSTTTDDKHLELDVKEIDIGNCLDKEVPLIYCTRLISKLFLLPGNAKQLVSDKVTRVSVKSLALSCLATIFRLYPKSLLLYLDKSSCRNRNQPILAILLYSNHSDPQLRGITRILIANFAKAVLLNYDNYDKFIETNTKSLDDYNNELSMENVLNMFIKGLEDESSSCTRQTISALMIVLNNLLESDNCGLVKPLLYALPLIESNTYWLVKVALCELVAILPFITIYHILGTEDFQNKIIFNVLFEMLKNSDQRVRTAAANSIVSIIPNLYYETFKKESVITTKAGKIRNDLLSNLYDQPIEMNLNRRHFIENIPFPYNQLTDNNCDNFIDFALSKIIYRLYNFILSSTNKYFISGCLETLSGLVTTYPSTLHNGSWILTSYSKDSVEKIPDLLNLCLNLLTNSEIAYDLSAHINILNLTLNLYAGQALILLRPIEDVENSQQLWDMFPGNYFRSFSEEFLSHIVKLLNIFHHVINGIVPAAPSQTKTVISNLPSPIKRRKSDLDKKHLTKTPSDKDEKILHLDKKVTMSAFLHLPHYAKILEVLRTSFTNYKMSLEMEASEKFLDLLRKSLESLLIIMEVATLTEFSRIADDILFFLKSIFNLDSVASVECVQQLLKCLFGTNLTANISEIIADERLTNSDDDLYGFYGNICQKPYEDMAKCVNSLRNISESVECDGDSTLMGYLHRKSVKKSTTLSKSSEKTLANYIRIFEPMVIKSLKQYTITSDIKLQCKVLQLLSQLIQLRVNYCLLDSDQVFIGFVFKQFEFIEEGQILMVETLIPKIFQFLVQLSYSKQHSKCIIGVPKIIQLCDGLMASEQSAETHCIPALKPIVEDIFLARNKANTSNLKELETTREVVLSMLLKMCEHRQVIDLLAMILEESKYCAADNSEKWSKWSQQIFDVVLPMLRINKIKFDNEQQFVAFRKFLFTLNPCVFKNLDLLIISLFQDPPTEGANLNEFSTWLSNILLLLLIISTMNEEVLLQKISTLKAEFSPKSVFKNISLTNDPLNVTNSADIFQNVSSELILIRFFLRVIAITSKQSMEVVRTGQNHFLVQQFSKFFMMVLHIFQSGSHCKLANIGIDFMNADELIEINETFFNLANFYPTLTFQWCYFLTLLNYKDKLFWERVFRQRSGLNSEISRVGAAIVFCDFLTENNIDNKDLIEIILKNLQLLVGLSDEAPVTEFISSLHRDSNTSKLFVDHLVNLEHIQNAVFKSQVLKCIENCHQSQIGSVLKFLLRELMNCKQAALSRLFSNLANRKIELLLTLSKEEVNNQLSKEEIFAILEAIRTHNLTKKHEALVGLINKLCTNFYDLSPLELNQHRILDPQSIKQLKIDKSWYENQIKTHLNDTTLRKEMAQLLSKLTDYNDLLNFLNSHEFHKSGLLECLKFGVKPFESTNLENSELPVIVRASIDCIFKHLDIIAEKLPQHQVYSPVDRNWTKEEEVYFQVVNSLFQDNQFFHLVVSLTNPLTYFVRNLSSKTNISDSDKENILKFATINLEIVNYLSDIDRNELNVNLIDAALNCASEVYKMGFHSHLSYFASAVNSLYKLVNVLLKDDKPLPSVPPYGLKVAINDEKAMPAGQACHQLYILSCWLYKMKNSIVNIPNFLLDNIQSVVASLGRLPFANSYFLIPEKVWKSGYDVEFFGSFNTQVPSLPIEYLQEIDILEEYIFRINLLGWTSRQQFEETWMCLLSVLCTPTEDADQAELNEIAHAASLSIKAITSLLLQTIYFPVPGNSNVSKLLHISRDLPIDEATISVRKLRKVQNFIEHQYRTAPASLCTDYEFRNVFCQRNFEKTSDKYSYGQLSVRYLLIATSDNENVENSLAGQKFKQRKVLLEEMGLDINSCLQFLVDYYTQLMKPQSMTSLRVLFEAVRSTVIISDLFTDKSQFTWMLDIFLELSNVHLMEDELLHQYLIVGICKAAAVLTPDLEIYEQIKKILMQFLKSPFLPARIACLHGILYILEGCKISNISIGGISEEMQIMLPCAVEYVTCHINTTNGVLRRSKEHSHLVWSLAFYIIENVDQQHVDMNFVTNTLQTAFTLLQNKFNNSLHKAVIKGLERLLLVRNSVKDIMGKHYLKLALDKMKHDNPVVALRGTQLLLTYMYTDCADHLEKKSNITDFDDEDQSSPDHLVQTIEKLSAIFERIKKGYAFEVDVLCNVLPIILDDFFSPSDILTKVIGEFLSPQQQYPKFLSHIVFNVFLSAINRNQIQLLQDWLLFSLSNFTQSFSISMATWSLTCFFISASTNEWLRALFPYLQTRVGRYEFEDRELLCITAADFYNNLKSDKQRSAFVDHFNHVKNLSDTPFFDLLSSL